MSSTASSALRDPYAERSAEGIGASRPKVAIVIPCYNVARHIASVVESIPRHYHPIVTVDDASTDDTVGVLERLGDQRVVLIRHATNRGVGGATKTGYEEALRRSADICVKMDGDGQMSGEDLDALVAPLIAGGSDYSKGNRFVDLRALRAMPRVRLVGNALLSLACKAASGYWNMLDVTNGFTAIRAEMLRRIAFDNLSERYFFESSMLIELSILRARVADVEMPARYGDERSSLKLSRVLASFPGLLLRGLLRRVYWRYFIQDFGATSVLLLVGALLTIGGGSFGVYRWWLSVATGIPATAGTVILAAVPLLGGFQCFLGALLLDVVSTTSRKVRVGDGGPVWVTPTGDYPVELTGAFSHQRASEAASQQSAID